jgi:ABC-type phosphate transport system substrate-binding protein
MKVTSRVISPCIKSNLLYLVHSDLKIRQIVTFSVPAEVVSEDFFVRTMKERSMRVLLQIVVGGFILICGWIGFVQAHEDSLGHGHPDHTLLLHGSGTTNPSRCYWTILETLTEQTPLAIRATYRGIGSTNGMLEFAHQFNSSVTAGIYPNFFGSGDIPITQELYDQINESSPNSTTPQFVHIPVVAGTISFFHSVAYTPNLNLTACVLSQIYQQQITMWDDIQIQELNPELSSNATGLKITVLVRSEGSSSTHAATNVR